MSTTTDFPSSGPLGPAPLGPAPLGPAPTGPTPARLGKRTAQPRFIATRRSPVGNLVALADEEGRIAALGFGELPRSATRALRGLNGPPLQDEGPFSTLFEQLDAYFAGDLRRFEVSTAAAGSAFQRRVWRALSEVPYGVTVSYGQLAERSGHPGAARAIGSACRTNPIAIVVPCHRVIGASGSLTGYAGGMERKRALLAHEGVTTAPMRA